ncbi:hypothetical protein AKJ37_05285 [candidate division MSBL1 archaeon SCGC-AAA259I09]|uniref:Uncharacterized protein n=1 Tax=candidate division MSBL1 archaeon SCGC-AAA259I09 TaxID=1698267 RepID=A0A133UQJ7_9EURY|nr:hypothetical protein AKJ37_05285 [candidate division MSBL1 archaeon SCGC-AAA259I09]
MSPMFVTDGLSLFSGCTGFDEVEKPVSLEIEVDSGLLAGSVVEPLMWSDVVVYRPPQTQECGSRPQFQPSRGIDTTWGVRSTPAVILTLFEPGMGSETIPRSWGV